MPEDSATKAETLVEAAVDEYTHILPKIPIKTEYQTDSSGVPIFERAQQHTFKYTKTYQEAWERDHEDFFWEKCYPNLFPYGRGGPSDPRYSRGMKLSICFKNFLERGGNIFGMQQGRRFQASPSFIFAAFVNDARKRISSVSIIASKSLHQDPSTKESVTVGDIKSVIKDAAIEILNGNSHLEEEIPTQCAEEDEVSQGAVRLRVRQLIEKLVPFSSELRGSPIYFSLERKKLLSMLTSPVITKEGSWTWFATFAAPEVYEQPLYDIAGDTLLDPSQPSTLCEEVRNWNKEKRLQILKDSPALSARLFHIKQNIFWEKVLLGVHQPLGAIGDWWRRVEFQKRGTPHCHAMGTIIGDMNDEETSKSWVKNHLTAILAPRPIDSTRGPMKDHIEDLLENITGEDDYLWRPPREYFPDSDDPRRASFIRDLSSLNFCVDVNLNFTSHDTQRAYRRWQLSNQIHYCCFTCWKYNLPRDSLSGKCRFCMPVNIENVSINDVTVHTQIISTKRKRKRIRYHPPRNNGHLNQCIKSPLVALAHGGNHDCQRIANLTGAAEYIATYNSKQDDPDFRAIDNLYANKIANLRLWKATLQERDHLRAAANAVCSAQHISTVQAVYTLLRLPFVQSSRKVTNINCLRRKDMTKSVVFKMKDLEEMDPEVSAELKGLQSSIGRRDAYHLFMKQQRDLPSNITSCCSVSLFALYTTFSVREKRQSEKISEPKLMNIDERGFIMNPERFSISDIVFTVNQRRSVVNMSPFIPVNFDDERFCYAMLLLHIPWPPEGEEAIVPANTTAVEALNNILKEDDCTHVLLKQLLAEQAQSQAFLSGIPDQGDGNHHNENDESDEDDNDIGTMHPTNSQHIETFDEDDDSDVDELQNIAKMMTSENIIFNSAQIKKISKQQYDLYASFIQTKAEEYWRNYSASNQILETCGQFSDLNLIDKSFQRPLLVDNYIMRKQVLDDRVSRLKGAQLSAYLTATSHISGQISDPLALFLTGEGGTGKSEVIKLVVEYTILKFGKQKGFFGAAIAMGPTGSSSRNINGFTWHSVLKMSASSKRQRDLHPSLQTRQRIGKDIDGVKFIVIDEVSLLSGDDLEVLEQRFRLSILTTITNEEERARRANMPFAGIHVMFGGDFYQLPPVCAQGLYMDNNKKGRQLWVTFVNKFIYLKQNFRLNNNNEGTRLLASCLSQLRIGTVTQQSLDVLNSRVAITEEAIETKTKDLGCLWIAPTNDIVVSRNTKCFKALVAENQEFFRFFATHQQERLYELPKEVELNLRRNTNKDCLPPILDLAIGSRVRVTRNKAAFLGLYNGALGTVIGFRFFGFIPQCRAPPKDYYGNQPQAIILVEMDDVDITCDRTRPRIISFGRHEDHDRRIKGNDGRSYIRTQFPLECAHASTIHKSQGITLTDKHAAIIVKPEPTFMGGDYVAISRVTDLHHLHLTRPVTAKHFTSHNVMRSQIKSEYLRLQEFHVPLDDITNASPFG